MLRHIVIVQRLKLLISRLFIGRHRLSDYHCSAFRNHEGSTFTEKDRKKLNYRIGPRRSDAAIKLVSDLITDSDQAVRAVHSCNSRFLRHFFTKEVMAKLIKITLFYIFGLLKLDYSGAWAYCTCSRSELGLFGHFFSSRLSFLSSFSLSLGGGRIQIEILSQRAVKSILIKQPIILEESILQSNLSYGVTKGKESRKSGCLRQVIT